MRIEPSQARAMLLHLRAKDASARSVAAVRQRCINVLCKARDESLFAGRGIERTKADAIKLVKLRAKIRQERPALWHSRPVSFWHTAHLDTLQLAAN